MYLSLSPSTYLVWSGYQFYSNCRLSSSLPTYPTLPEPPAPCNLYVHYIPTIGVRSTGTGFFITPQSRLACLPCNLGRPSPQPKPQKHKIRPISSTHLVRSSKRQANNNRSSALSPTSIHITYSSRGRTFEPLLLQSDRRHLPHASPLVIFLEPSWSRSNFSCSSSTLDTTNPFAPALAPLQLLTYPTSTYLPTTLSTFENPTFREKILTGIAFCRHLNSPISLPTITRRPPAGRLGAPYISTR